MLRVIQEFPREDDHTFQSFSEELSRLYVELFVPLSIERNSVGIQSYVPFSNFAKAESLTLEWSSDSNDRSHDEFMKVAGMTPTGSNVDKTFRSGSKEFHIKFRPITFENVGLVRRTAPGLASSRAIERASRQNKGTDRVKNLDLAHAALVELELAESTPPADSFSAIFAEVLEKEAALVKRWFKV